jgi:predicted lipid-binding transport protein (Tim44 family)
MTAGQLPIDLILFGMIALFLVLRLRSILGKRQGFEGVPEMKPRRGGMAPVIEGRAEAPPATPRKMPDPASPTGQALAAMRAMDKHFDPASFLTGAEGAFRLIVTSFATGDRDKLRGLLTPETYSAFEAAITAREAVEHTQRTEIRSILEATIEEASLVGSLAHITVKFVSHQITLTTAADGSIVAGADAVTELVDIWSFVRDLKGSAPVWRLAAAQNA